MPLAMTYSARVSILELEIPGMGSVPAGILLEDPAADRLYPRLRRDFEEIAPDEADVLSALEHDLEEKSAEMGAARLLGYLGDTLSNVLRLSEPREVVVENFDRAVSRLYRENVKSTVRPFVTHLPRYSLTVAAGPLLDNQEVSEEGWEEVPADLVPTCGMYAARITGRSMEPLIPGGSLCVFRKDVTGSRNGRLVLVEELGRGGNDRYTVKRYRSEKTRLPDGSWSHQRIRLEPLNPDFEAWDLKPEEERFRVLAEFVRVLD